MTTPDDARPDGATCPPEVRPAPVPPAWASLAAMVDAATRAELAALAPEAEALLPLVRRLAARSRRALAVFQAACEAHMGLPDAAHEWLRALTGAGRLYDVLFELTRHLEGAEPASGEDPLPAWVAEQGAGEARPEDPPPAWLDLDALVETAAVAAVRAAAAQAEALRPSVLVLAERANRALAAYWASYERHETPDGFDQVAGRHTGETRLHDALADLAGWLADAAEAAEVLDWADGGPAPDDTPVARRTKDVVAQFEAFRRSARDNGEAVRQLLGIVARMDGRGGSREANGEAGG